MLTVGLRMPHRVRMAAGNVNGKRKKTIELPGVHVWMAHSGAIWDLDPSTRSYGDGSPPLRGASASASTAGLLRDDRSTLARQFNMSAMWYGVDQTRFGSLHQGAEWALRCCGDIPTSTDYDGGGVVYPMPGQVVQYLNANGQRLEINSPCSSIVYDNGSGITTWTTDWQNLDFSKGGFRG